MRKTKGMALLIVMLLIALMATLAVGMTEFWQHAFTRTLANQERIKAKWNLLGGEVYALLQLEESLLNKESVNLGQWWAQSDLVMKTEDSTVELVFHNGQACFNLNSLSYRFPKPPEDPKENEEKKERIGAEEKDAGPKREITQQVFDALLLNIGLNDAEVKLVSNQIEARLMPETQQDNALLFGDVSELRELKGITREQYLRLRPLVCVLPERKPAININTLRAEHLPLLQAIFLNKASRENIQSLLAARPALGWESLDDTKLKSALNSLNTKDLESVNLLATKSNYFMLETSIKNERTGYYMKSLLHYQKQKIKIIRRQIGQGEAG